MAERFGGLPLDVLRKYSWEMMYATMEIVNELETYRDWSREQKRGSNSSAGKDIGGVTIPFSSFMKARGNVQKDGTITG